jgi:hypothetical protein
MPTIDELVKARAHFDASVHVGGHPGEPWPEHKCLVLTKDGQTWLCELRDGAEVVTAVPSVRAGLEMFAAALEAAIRELPLAQ